MLHAYNIHIMHVMYWRNVDGLIRYAREFSIALLPLKNQRSRFRLDPYVRMLRFVNEELSNQRDNRGASLESRFRMHAGQFLVVCLASPDLQTRSIVPKSPPLIQMKDIRLDARFSHLACLLLVSRARNKTRTLTTPGNLSLSKEKVDPRGEHVAK